MIYLAALLVALLCSSPAWVPAVREGQGYGVAAFGIGWTSVAVCGVVYLVGVLG